MNHEPWESLLLPRAKNDNADAWNNEEEDYDDILFSRPDVVHLEEGRRLGRLDGLAAGFDSGYELGQVTAMDYGVEIGFIRGAISVLSEAFSSNDPNNSSSNTNNASLSESVLFGGTDTDSHHRARVEKTLADLKKMLDNFPSPSDLFPNDTKDRQNVTENEKSNVEDKTSARDQLQRIRARFKLLSAQLGMPHLSLTKIMADADAASSTASVNDATPSREW